MAQKKTSALEQDLKNADLMSILSSGSDSRVFSKNEMIDYSYPCGIPLIDYPLGYEIIICDSDGKEIGRRVCLGFQAGTFNVLTGPTQTYKSTIGTKIAFDIAFGNGGNVVHLDPENRAVLQRIMNITRAPRSWFDGDNPRYRIINGAIGFDYLQEIVTEIWKQKVKHKDLLLRDTGVVDHNNKPIVLMPPTCIFLDSIADVISRQYDINDKKIADGASELRSNTYGMITAKTLRGLIADILPMLKEANIMFFTVAHQNTNAAMGVTPPKKQFQYGSHDVKMGGGKALEYDPSTIATFTNETSADSRYHEDSDGFEGNTIVFEPTKSSTNESGNAKTGLGFRMVVDKGKGCVDNLRSLVLFLNGRGLLKGNKAGYRVIDKNGEPISERFTWRHIYEDFEKDPASYKIFIKTAKDELETFISPATNFQEEPTVFSFDSILNS